MITIPEGVTDPDEIDRLLDAEDVRRAQQAAGRADRDDALMAAVPRSRPNPDAVRSPATKAEIQARIAYDREPFWERCRLTLKGERPAGYVDRHPKGRVH